MKSLSLIVCLIIMIGYINHVEAVTDAELEALEKQVEELEVDEKKKAEEEVKRKAEEKRKVEVEAEQKRVEEEKRKAEEARLAAEEKRKPEQIQAEYQQAFGLLKQSQYDQAIKAFAKFIKAYPDNQYSDNAQYWMAEALYVKRQYEDAIREYNNLVSNYPDSPKVPHGLLKIGYSYQELDKAYEAKRWYTVVRQRFPGTTASRLADDRLKHIND